MAIGNRCATHTTSIYQQTLALTSLTSSGSVYKVCLQTKSPRFFLCYHPADSHHQHKPEAVATHSMCDHTVLYTRRWQHNCHCEVLKPCTILLKFQERQFKDVECYMYKYKYGKNKQQQQKIPWPLVRKRTIPTE
jgi:hypothetical protein